MTFLLTPFVISRIGTEAYGLYVLLISVTGLLGFMGYGLGEAVLRNVAHDLGRGDIAGVNRVFGTGFSVSLGLAAVALSGFFLGAPLIASLLKLPAVERDLAAGLLRWTGLTFAVNLAGGGFSSIPQALQRYDIRTKAILVQSLFQACGTIVLLWCGYGLYELVIWLVASTVLAQVLNVAVAKALIGELRFRPAFSRRGFGEVFGYSVFSILTYAFGTLWFYGDRFILGASVGAAAVAYLAVPHMLVFRAMDFVSSAGNVLLPRFSTMTDDGQRRRLYLQASWAVTACSVMVFVPLTVILPGLLRLWVGEEFAAEGAVIGQLIAASSIVRGGAVVYQGLFNGLGKPQLVSAVMFTSASLSLLTNVLLIPRYGLAGAGYSYCLTGLIALATAVVAWRWVLKERSILPVLGSTVAPVSTGAVCLGALLVVRSTLPQPGW
ncbi:MAG: oligosaccharide flippase family protein, partial [Acidobacteriota bacterium]